MEMQKTPSMLRDAAVCLAITALLTGCATVGENSGGSGTVGKSSGKLYIVGMGTAPDLITLRGIEAIKSTTSFWCTTRKGFRTGKTS